ncbi:hypothetical protein COOONC_01614 [Cooperia oncophora]
MSSSGIMDSSTMNNDARSGELFSFFDNAMDYFTVTREEAFEKLLSRANQLPRKFEKSKICCEQLKQRYLTKLRSVEQRLEQMNSLKRELTSECEELQQRESCLGSEIADYQVKREGFFLNIYLLSFSSVWMCW